MTTDTSGNTKMSIEEKAKAYDEALERAKQKIDAGFLTEDDLSYIFPELRESEDEKTRTLLVALVQWAKTFNQSGLDHNTSNKMLSYLEKQKEQKPCEDSGTDGDIMQYIEEGEKRGIKEVISFPEKYGLHKEPKPAEWSEEDEQFLLICKNALYKYQRTDQWDANIISKWLEERLKSIHPSWKPSEEQMNALVSARFLYRDRLENSAIASALESLCVDLNKLRYGSTR